MTNRVFEEVKFVHIDPEYMDIMLLRSKTTREFFLVKIIANGLLDNDT